jgi:hypothetical protein
MNLFIKATQRTVQANQAFFCIAVPRAHPLRHVFDWFGLNGGKRPYKKKLRKKKILTTTTATSKIIKNAQTNSES